ncbi:recombinase family protein [Vibrio genomosp. F10]|nr:recombinase family protein [Vibrio genomosp. F10]
MIDKILILKGGEKSFSNWVKQACLERINREDLGGKSVRPPNSDAVCTASKANKDLVYSAKDLSAKGLFNQQIADTFNERGIKSPNGKVWNRRMISILLTQS